MDAKQGLPIVAFASQEDWERWLEEHHEDSRGLWVKIAKKGSGHETVLYPAALESALCYGWIDGQKDALDEEFWLQKFTPRRAGSRWSRINRDKAADLLAQRRMRPAGLEEVERARADGRWDSAYAGQRRATVPEDLQRELDRKPEAKAFFAALDSANRYAILYRIDDAKKPETRARRIEQYVAMLAEHRKLHD